MSLGERVWDTFTTVMQIRDKIASLTEVIKTQQTQIHDLTGRIIRLETALELGLIERGARALPDRAER